MYKYIEYCVFQSCNITNLHKNAEQTQYRAEYLWTPGVKPGLFSRLLTSGIGRRRPRQPDKIKAVCQNSKF